MKEVIIDDSSSLLYRVIVGTEDGSEVKKAFLSYKNVFDFTSLEFWADIKLYAPWKSSLAGLAEAVYAKMVTDKFMSA